MKTCLKCGQTYSDDTLNFCLNDGEMLVREPVYAPPPTKQADDSPPTLLMDQPRVTNPIDWPQSSPIQWQGQSPASTTPMHGMVGYGAPLNKTLPIISLVLGIVAVVCCFGGIALGPLAAVFGFIGLRNADNDPRRYAGRGMAIAGIILGIIAFSLSIAFLFFGQLS